MTTNQKLTQNRAERVRTAPCHRCGWTSELHRPHRHGHGHAFGLGHDLHTWADTHRWLCAECAAELDHPAGSAIVPGTLQWSAARLRYPIGARN